MLTVGIDPHKKTHTAVIIDPSGDRLGQAVTVPDDADAVVKLREWASINASGQPVRWAIEDGRGMARRLATALAVTGESVVWVPVRLMVKARNHTGPRGKSDSLDALAVAVAAQRPDNQKYLARHTSDEPGADLAPLVDYRADLVAQRTQLISRLRWRLHQLDAGLEPASLTTLKAPHHLAQQLHTYPTGTLRDVLLANCDDLERLTTKINDLDRDLAARTHDLCPTLLTIPGVGPTVAATIIAEIGHPARIRNAAAFARLTGTAPIDVATSGTDRQRLDRGGNRRLNTAIHTVALTQARHHEQAQAIITRHQHHKGRRGAMRILKRHLTDVVYRTLTTDLTTSNNTTT
ncbi:transposase [Haloactinopolyspora alba]|uniref:Transposase n=2 Tax=Haloactinopolyspora alba TaxID=648780 RepID=A0A2P8CWV3_9ACTN|nr:IS110 family transposase [Haloactinopolyspora alba]PSK89448.1 transposase [Haloactinopolyspora alba]